MQRLLLLLLIYSFAGAGFAASLPPAARAEIDGLLAKLESSSCQFNRNGTWYSAKEAKSHLLRKLKYLEDRGALRSAEQFIEQAASSSSATGEPYLVKCGQEAPVRSGPWMLSALQAMRASGQVGTP